LARQGRIAICLDGLSAFRKSRLPPSNRMTRDSEVDATAGGVQRQLARLSQFKGIFGYFQCKTATKFNDCSEAISKKAAVKTYPLAKA